VTSEPDGGATIVCLAGRTRVVSGLCDPVVLGPDQTAAVASDGATLVLVDRLTAGTVPDHHRPVPESGPPKAGSPPVPTEPAIPLPAGDPRDHEATSDSSAVVWSDAGSNEADDADRVDGRRRRLPWMAEVMALAALLAVVVAAVLVFGRGSSDDTDVAEAPGVTAVETTQTSDSPTTDSPTTDPPPSVPTTSTPTTAPPETAVPTSTTVAPAAAAPGTAQGELVGCRRGEGGVTATISVSHRSGGPGRFAVMVGLVDAVGAMFAEGSADSGVVDRGATAPVDVWVPVETLRSGACELLGVAPA